MVSTKHVKESRIDPVVFGISMGLIVIFCVIGAVFPERLGDYANAVLTWIVGNLGWAFILASTAFVVFALFLAFSRYGRIPLSRSGEAPEFSRISWVAMMFSAGMGIGLIFFGVMEPVAHLAEPAPWLEVRAGSPDAARRAMGYTFFHWGLHPWAIYAVVALALAYSTYRMGRGNLLSAPFQSLSRKENVANTWWGKFINIWAIVATKFGGATSLGLGALQISGGIWLFTGIGSGFSQQGGTKNVAFLVILVLVVFAILSAVSGVARGIKWLSNTNMVLAAVLALFVVVVGPTVFILNMIPDGYSAYLTNLVEWSFRAPTFGGVDWMTDWTIFYWAWWISWTPFVSTFIARISRGRTIREFVLGVLIVPTAVSSLWFIVFGSAGINLQMAGRADIADAPNEAVAFFTALEQYPLYTISGGVVMFLVAIFWVSGADASALVLATLSSRGITEPSRWLTALWAAMSAAVAAVLLYAGGLDALQTFTIIVACPFVVVMIGLCWALHVDLRRDPLRQRPAGPMRSSRVPAEEQSAPEGGGEGGAVPQEPVSDSGVTRE